MRIMCGKILGVGTVLCLVFLFSKISSGICIRRDLYLFLVVVRIRFAVYSDVFVIVFVIVIVIVICLWSF